MSTATITVTYNQTTRNNNLIATYLFGTTIMVRTVKMVMFKTIKTNKTINLKIIDHKTTFLPKTVKKAPRQSNPKTKE